MSLPPLNLSGGATTSGGDMRGASWAFGSDSQWHVDMGGYSSPPMVGGFNSQSSIFSSNRAPAIDSTLIVAVLAVAAAVYFSARR